MDHSNNHRHIIVMRHGERIDNSSTDSMNQKLKEYDPELTIKGVDQAKSIGEQLLLKIPQPIQSVKVYSSPFTRTLQTGNAVAQSAFKGAKVSFHIHEGLSELFGLKQFKCNPLSTLLYNDSNSNDYKTFLSFLNDNQSDYSGYSKLKYPETFEEGIERYRNSAKELVDMIKKGNDNVSIIVTHGYGVSVIVHYLSNLDETLIDYCTSFLYHYKNDNFEFKEELNPLLI